MAFDYKKEYREFYMPDKKPSIVNVLEMNYVSVRGSGDPNAEDGEYKASVNILYAVAYTLKMSRLTDHRIEGYFDFVVPPLEGFWQQEGNGIDYSRKDKFKFISVIRLPDFVTKEEFEWAVKAAERKKKTDLSKAEFLTLEEGLCVQCMHIGPYDSEPETVKAMRIYMEQHDLALDISESRLHHEIYLSDPRKTSLEKLKTVIRHPVRNI